MIKYFQNTVRVVIPAVQRKIRVLTSLWMLFRKQVYVLATRIRGTHDLFPEDCSHYRFIEQTLERIVRTFGFQEISL